MATELRSSSETTPSIGVVRYSTTIARPPERFDLRTYSSFTISARAKLGKRGIVFPSITSGRAKAKKFSLDFYHRLAHRPPVDHAAGSGRYDGIFGEHADNEGEARRRAKLDGSQSVNSSPSPEGGIPKKYAERRADWKKCFVAMKKKQATTLRGKRSSLRTWLTRPNKHEPEAACDDKVSSDAVPKPLWREKSLKFRNKKRCSHPTIDKSEVLKKPEKCLASPSLTSDDTTTSIAQSTNPVPPQTPKKVASTGSIRTNISFDNDLAVPRRNQEPTKPTLRTRPDTRSNPWLRPLNPIDERNLHPSLRNQPFARLNPPPLISETTHTHTHTLDINSPPILSSKPPTLREKTDLVRSLNIARSSVCAKLLDLHPLLSNRAQDYIGISLPLMPPPSPLPLGHQHRSTLVAAAAAAASTAAMNHTRQQQQPQQPSTTIETISFKHPNAANAIRLISSPGLGALACGELWAGGKYKRHKRLLSGEVVGGTWSSIDSPSCLTLTRMGGRASLLLGVRLLCLRMTAVVVQDGAGVPSTILGRPLRNRSGTLWELEGMGMGGRLLSCGRVRGSEDDWKRGKRKVRE
jgi:hypothetical protein